MIEEITCSAVAVWDLGWRCLRIHDPIGLAAVRENDGDGVAGSEA
ncbi:MAG: hypothetical protein R2706_02910 [Acidimicrobiales bacterium]